MNDLEKLNLQKMITENDVQDNTDLIRTYKHSDKIRKDVETLVNLRDNHKDDIDFDDLAQIFKTHRKSAISTLCFSIIM